MAEGLEYLIGLKEQISGPAAKAAAAFEALQLKASLADKSLSKMDKANLQAAAAMKQVGKAYTLADIEKKIAAEKKAADILKKAADEQKKSIEASIRLQDKLAAEQEANARKALATQKKVKISQDKDKDAAIAGVKATAAAYAAIGVAALAAAGAVALLAVKGIGLAIGATEYKEQTIATLGQIKGVGKGADQVFASVRKISDQLGVSEDSAQKLAAELLKSGVSQANLGEEIKKRLNPTGIITFGMLVAKFQEKFVRMFESVSKAVDSFKSKLAPLFALFDEGTAVGDTIRDAIGGAFNILLKAAELAIPYIVRGIKQVIIWALEAYIFMQPLIASFVAWWQVGNRLEYLTLVLDGIKKMLMFIAAVIIAVVTVMAILWTVGAAVISGLYVGFSKLVDGILFVFDMVSNLGSKGVQIAGDFIKGLIQGIKDGIGAVFNAVSGVAKAMVSAVTGGLDSHSPSRVMMKIGGYATEGLAQGAESVDIGTPMSNVANDMVSGAAAGASSAVGSSSGGGGGGMSISVPVTINGVANAETLVQILPGVLTNTFEQIAIQFGGNLNPQGAQ